MKALLRVTQKDVATAAGTTQPAVSLALRGHPRVPAATRRRILAVAKRLGYRPDPMLTALAGYRNQTRSPAFHGVLAWLADSRSGVPWRERAQVVGFHASATAAAASLGYQLDTLDLRDLGVDWPRAGRIAAARGVLGVVLCSLPSPACRIDGFPWEKFCAVTFDSTLDYPRLDSVGAAHAQIMMRTLDELHARGYRRIGLALRPLHDQHLAHNYSAAYLAFHHKHGLTPPPVCPDDGIGSAGETLRVWLAAHQPDALVSAGNPRLVALLARWGLSVPGDLGLACPVVPDDDDHTSGVREDPAEVGRAAVELLVAKIQRGERGPAEKPKRLLVPGTWLPGRTLRPLSL